MERKTVGHPISTEKNENNDNSQKFNFSGENRHDTSNRPTILRTTSHLIDSITSAVVILMMNLTMIRKKCGRQRFHGMLLLLAIMSGYVLMRLFSDPSNDVAIRGIDEMKEIASDQQSVDIVPRYYMKPNTTKHLKSQTYKPDWLVLSPIHKIATTIIPKVMSTSIRDSMNEPNCVLVSNYSQRCVEARSNPNVNKIDLDEQNYTTFIILRDPFDRAYSAYRNSNVNKHIYLKDKCSDATQCTFEEWVDGLKSLAFTLPRKRNSRRQFTWNNEHFKPQTEIGQFNKMHYHYILRMSSNIDVAFYWKSLIRSTNGPIHANDSSSKNSKSSQLASKNTTNYRNHFFSSLNILNSKHNRQQQSSSGSSSTKENSPIKIMEEKYNRIAPQRTMDILAELYHTDLQIWSQLLKEGTRRSENEEITLYDIYMMKSNYK